MLGSRARFLWFEGMLVEHVQVKFVTCEEGHFIINAV